MSDDSRDRYWEIGGRELKRERKRDGVSSQSLSEFAKLRDCVATAMAIGVFKQTSADATNSRGK